MACRFFKGLPHMLPRSSPSLKAAQLGRFTGLDLHRLWIPEWIHLFSHGARISCPSSAVWLGKRQKHQITLSPRWWYRWRFERPTRAGDFIRGRSCGDHWWDGIVCFSPGEHYVRWTMESSDWLIDWLIGFCFACLFACSNFQISAVNIFSICSSQTFKQQAAEAVSKGSQDDDVLLSQSIPHEKFLCDSRQKIHDIISLGVNRITAFEQLLNASLLGGRGATTKPPAPVFRRFIVVGSSPLCASYAVVEGENFLVLGQVAKAVATKVTNAVTSRISATANRFGLQVQFRLRF